MSYELPRCRCGHDAQTHSEECDSGSGAVLCRYDCGECECAMYEAAP